MQPLDQCKVADIKMSVKYGSKFNAFNYLAKLKKHSSKFGQTMHTILAEMTPKYKSVYAGGSIAKPVQLA